MSTRSRIIAAVTLVLGLAFGGALYAQQMGEMDGEGMSDMMGMMSMMESCPMMGAMSMGPEEALEHRGELELTGAQVEKLEVLAEGTDYTRTRAMKRMKELHAQIASATEGARFNADAARAAFEEMGALHTEMAMAMLRTAHDVRTVLTPEQREELAELGGGMMDMMMRMMKMMRGMGGGMDMDDCPMMEGGMDMNGGTMQNRMEMRGPDGTSMRQNPRHGRMKVVSDTSPIGYSVLTNSIEVSSLLVRVPADAGMSYR